MKQSLLFFTAFFLTYMSFAQVDPNTDCPAPNTFFVGDYQISDGNAVVGPGNGTSNFEAGIVTISATGNTRTFQSAVLPAFNGEIETINFILNCGVIQIEDVDPALSCNGVNAYTFTTTDIANSTTYSLTENDTTFEINYIEDPLGSCGGPFNSSFVLTRICSNPQNISATNVTATSLDLNWTDANNALFSPINYTVEHGNEGFTPGTGQTITGITGTTATVNSLTTNVSYDFYVQGFCSDGSFSGLVGPFNFTIQDTPNPDFILAPNGVSCLCPDANFGDSGTILTGEGLKTFTKRSREQLDALIAADIQDPEIALTCTTGITDMSGLFSFFVVDPSSFNQNLQHWDVSNVTNMESMFVGATIFNQPLNDWNTSSVTNMFQVFGLATAFNQPLDNWDVSSVTNMRNLFLGASAFNQNINNWDVGSVTNMNAMFNGFGGTAAFNQPLNNWDVGNVSNLSGMFANGSFNQPLDNWNVSGATNMAGMFENTPFNQQINNWNVGSVTNMIGMFSETNAFDQPLDNWDVSNVISMDDMFDFAAAFNQPLNNWSFNTEVSLIRFLDNSNLDAANYDALLQNFNSQNLTNLNLGAANLSYCDDQSRNELIDTKGWTIIGDFQGQCGDVLNPSTTAFLTTWTVQSDDLNIEIYTRNDAFDYNFDINWGDGQVNQNVTTDITHSYTNPGTYTVSITGIFPYFRTCEIATGDLACTNSVKLSTVESWGDQEWQLMIGSFRGASNFNINTTVAPNISNVTSLKETFRQASSFNQSLNNWNVSQVTDLTSTFRQASSLNQPFNNWDVSQVTDLTGTFQGAASFNQPLNNWNVSQVTDLTGTFQGASSFNQPLDNWDVSQVTDMTSTFRDASSFNQPLDNWDVGQVTDMTFTFTGASSFNQPINSWDVSMVTSMFGMFFQASSYNQPMEMWDVSSVTEMGSMFRDATVFNQDLSVWCVEQFTEEPFDFALNSALQNDFFPNWGAQCENLSTTDQNYSNIKVFPNPMNNVLNLDLGNQSNASVSLYDVSGKLILVQNITSNSYALDVSRLQSGLYLITINSNEKSITKRIIKE